MGHFCLSMLALVAAVALAWRATYEPGSRPRSNDRLTVWTVRALAPLGALTLFAGTAATAAGPHSGGVTGQHVHRLHFKGADTLTWVIHRHATIAALFGILVVGTWVLLRHRGVGDRRLEPVTGLGVLMAAQGLLGSVQYELRLPTDMVWLHVTLATLTWLAVLWSVAAAGTLVPRVASVPVAEPPPAAPQPLEPVG
jgi:cytochrome c oxidase assembly protein subunit 15